MDNHSILEGRPCPTDTTDSIFILLVVALSVGVGMLMGYDLAKQEFQKTIPTLNKPFVQLKLQ